MKNKKFIIFSFLLISLGLICFLWDFNNEMILTKEKIELINQDKNLGLVFQTPNMFDIYVRIIHDSILKLIMFLSPLLVVIPAFKNYKKNYIYNYAFILPIIFLYIILVVGIYSKFSLTMPNLYSNEAYFNSNIMFIILTLVNLFLSGIFYINIGILIKKYIKNYFVHVLSVFIIFLLIEGFLQFILIPFISFESGLSLLNLWFNSDCINNLLVTLFLLIINLISFIVIKKKLLD